MNIELTKAMAVALETWLAGCNKIRAQYYQTHFPNQPIEPLKIDLGARYIRVVAEGSAYAFIDKTSGDVLKPNSWKAPHPKARGNILAEDNGLGCMDAYGPKYLR